MYHHKDGTVVIPTNHLRRQTEDPAAKWVITDDMNFCLLYTSPSPRD